MDFAEACAYDPAMRKSTNRIACLTLALVAATATAAFACHDGSTADGTIHKGKHHHKKNVAGTAATLHQVTPTQSAQNTSPSPAPNPAGVGALL
jgi:hypothetical protein